LFVVGSGMGAFGSLNPEGGGFLLDVLAGRFVFVLLG